MSIKLGLQENNNSLIDELIALMQTSKVDYTSTFLLLSQAIDNQQVRQQLMTNLRNESWVTLWLECQKKENTKVEMERANPIYIPRNHLIEKAINDLLNQDDRRLFDTLLKVFQNPFQDEPNTEHLKHLPTDAERVQHTFCGT